MKHILTDLSQLSKAMFKSARKADEVKPAPPKTRPRDEGADVLAYFSRLPPGAKAAQSAPVCAQAANGTDAPAEVFQRERALLRARLRDAVAARSDAESKCADAEREREKLADVLAESRKSVEWLKNECERLQGVARTTAEAATGTADAREASSAGSTAERTPGESPAPRSGRHEGVVLALPAAFAEMFPGEMREMVLSALSEARDAAHQGNRERRAAILDAVLAANRPTGELERRRAQLKQAMKDCGYYTDPKSIERLGFKLVSGRTHWKLEYGTVRMPIAKTPSDYRANLNMVAELANRCF